MRNLYQYKKEYNLILEDMALSTFRKNINSFAQSNILDKKIAPSDINFIKNNLEKFNNLIKSVQSDDKIKTAIGPVENYIVNKLYQPEELFNRIKSLKTRIDAINAINKHINEADNSKLKNAWASYTVPDTNIIVFIPFTPEANRFLSHNVLTSPGQTIPTWCIASSSAKLMWMTYELFDQEYPPVFIFCRKSGIGNKYDDNKYEVVFTELDTTDAVNGKVSIFAVENEIEWRNPKQNEHGTYLGYDNKFRKTFPELAGPKVIDLMVMLMKKHYKEYDLIRNEAIKNIDDIYTFEDNKSEWKYKVPEAIEALKNGNKINIYDIKRLYNKGDFTSDFVDLMFIIVESDLFKTYCFDDEMVANMARDMPKLLENKEFFGVLIKNIRKLKVSNLFIRSSFFVTAVLNNILTMDEAVNLYYDKCLNTIYFIHRLLSNPLNIEDEITYKQFINALSKKLPALLPKLKNEYAPQESIILINEIAYHHKFAETYLEFFKTVFDMYYTWVTDSEIFELVEFNKIDDDIFKNARIKQLFRETLIKIFTKRPDFLKPNINFIKKYKDILQLENIEEINQRYNKDANISDISLINVLLSKFKDSTITLPKLTRNTKGLEQSELKNVIISILSYINKVNYDFSKTKLDVEDFFIWIINNIYDIKSVKEFWTLFDNNYQNLKYVPFYHGIDNADIQTSLCLHIFETFVKYNKVDKEWVDFYFGNWHRIMPRCREAISILQLRKDAMHTLTNDGLNSTIAKLAKLVRPYIPDDIFKFVFRGYYD